MNKTVKKIEDLRRTISYINFQDRLSSEDYKRIDELEAEIKQLQSELKGTKGVTVKLTRSVHSILLMTLFYVVVMNQLYLSLKMKHKII